MSDEQSNFDKKPGKKGSGSGSDFKVQPKKSKDYQVYFEAKGNEKGPKDQSSAQKGHAPSGHHDESHGPKTDSHGSNKPKSYAKNRKESRDHHPNVWKRKHPKVSKDSILDFYQKAPLSKEIDELVASCAQLFVKDKQIPVNQEENHLDPNDALMPKNAYPPANATASTTSTTATSLTSLPGGNTTTSTTSAPTNPPTSSNPPANSNQTAATQAPTANSGATTAATQPSTATTGVTTAPTTASTSTTAPLDPIQAMREKMKRDKAAKEQKAIEEANKRKESEQSQNTAEEKKAAPAPAPTQNQNISNKEQENQDKEAENGDKYSDIDEMYEKKLKNNQFEEGKNNEEEEHTPGGGLYEDDNQRPEWEGGQVREIGREEFMANLPQDKRTIFGDKYVEKAGGQQQLQQQAMRGDVGGVDFSKVSFDNEPRAMNDNFNIPSADMYGGRGAPQDNMGGYGGQDNMSRGAANQQMSSLYANKSYNANQGPVTPTSSAKQQQQQQAPPSIIFKYFSPNYDQKVWSYVDLEQKLQGPFSGRTMDEWYAKGYLPLNLHVTIGKNNGYKALQELADIIINHNSQESVPQPKEQVQKIPSATSLPEQQYQQQHYQQQQYYQQQQQQPQYQQQQHQQQYQQQYQQQQQQQPQYQQQQHQQQYQQQQYQQQQQQQAYRQQNPSANEMQRFHSDTSSYGTNFQTTANRTKAYEGSEVSNTYYGQQQQAAGGQYGGGQSAQDYHRSASASNIQSQNYYENYGSGNYYGQETQQTQQKPTQNYPAYKTSTSMNQGSAGYYQQEPSGYQGGYGQAGYNQPQKAATTQWKGGQQQQGQMSGGYAGQQMASSGGYGGQNAGYGGSYGGYGGQQSAQGNMGYGGQQQQMLNRGGSMTNMGGNPNMSGDMLKNMLGMQRPASRQGQEEPDYCSRIKIEPGIKEFL